MKKIKIGVAGILAQTNGTATKKYIQQELKKMGNPPTRVGNYKLNRKVVK